MPLRDWYPFLRKSPLTPPDWAFPGGLDCAVHSDGNFHGSGAQQPRPGRTTATNIFLLQLLANFSWSIAFFYLHSPTAGLGVISLLFVLLLLYVWKSLPISRLGASLFLPYLIWIGFAWYLNFYIVMHN